MIVLNKLLNVETLEQLIADGYISRKFHSKFPLAILNYSHKANFDPNLIWGNELNFCRGLIYNTETLEIVSRPFSKFWNINDTRHPETMEENLPNDIPLITSKMDGSMGVFYHWDGVNYIATRGSFESDQSNWANEWLHKNYPNLILPKNYTLLSEILFKSNRIVVEYDFEGLVILGAVHKETGQELSRQNLVDYCDITNLNIVQDHTKSLSECVSEDLPNFEGYVLTYSNGLKVKIKELTYCTLHKIITGLNPKAIWELKRDGKNETIDSWLNDKIMPIEFKNWLNKWDDQLSNDFYKILMTAESIFNKQPKTNSRKEIATYFLQGENKEYSSILFGLLDGKDVSQTIWRMIEPKFNDVFREDGE